MDKEKLEIAVKELRKATIYPMEYRIAKYLVKAGYDGWKDNIPQLIADLDPTLPRSQRWKIWGLMRDFKNIISRNHTYHIDNVPDLFPE